MIASERAGCILELFQEKGTVTFQDISDRLGISTATARRDVDYLAKKGLVLKVYGGAVLIKKERPPFPFAPVVTSEKMQRHIAEKIAIAQRATSFIQDGDCIFLDGGSTIAPMIDYLQNKQVRIVTHNMLVPHRLQNPDVDIFLIGGHYSPVHVSTSGVNTEKKVSQFHFDHAFFGCSGIDLERQMVYDDDIDTIPVKEVAMKHAAHTYLLADSSKLGTPSYCRFCEVSAFDFVITNDAAKMESLPQNFILVSK